MALCRNKVVLDIGCVDHKALTEKNPFWLHKLIQSVAKEVTGVDMAKEEVKKLSSKGYNIVAGNAETFKLNKKFDVIVAGELIEHVSNAGLFIENIKKHLKTDGKIALSTPNAFGIRTVLRNLLFGKIIPNKNHSCYYDYYTLKQLAERFDLKILSVYYYFDPKTNWQYFVERFFSFFRKVYAPQLLFILKKK